MKFEKLQTKGELIRFWKW